MSEIQDAVGETIESAAHSRFNSIVALLVALTATLMAICNIKDGNIVQAMALEQSKSVDAWSYYQSKSTKQNIAEAALEQVRLESAILAAQSAAAPQALADAASRYAAEVERYDREKTEIRSEAEGHAANYERLNVLDDQFDFAEAFLTVAIALDGIAVLTRKRWLLGFAILLTALGLAFGVSGFTGGSFHPAWLARLLG